MAEKSDRSLYYTFIVYEDSLPTDYQEIIETWYLPFGMSPWHDRDVWTKKDEEENPAHKEGQPKKKHKHCLIMFPSMKSFKQANEFAKQLNGTAVKIANSVNGLTRYFCHLDNPKKALYDIADIESFNGFDTEQFLQKPVPTDRHKMLKEMQMYIIKNEITEFVDFVDYCANNRYEDWFCTITDSATYYIKTIIDSNRYKLGDTKYQTGWEDGYKSGFESGYAQAEMDLGGSDEKGASLTDISITNSDV